MPCTGTNRTALGWALVTVAYGAVALLSNLEPENVFRGGLQHLRQRVYNLKDLEAKAQPERSEWKMPIMNSTDLLTNVSACSMSEYFCFEHATQPFTVDRIVERRGGSIKLVCALFS